MILTSREVLLQQAQEDLKSAMEGIKILDDPSTSSPETPLLQEIRSAIGEAYEKVLELKKIQIKIKEATL